MKTVDDIELEMTCEACPEQYDAMIDGKVVGYLRMRHGIFTVRCPNSKGEVVYYDTPKGDGSFEDGERNTYLISAKEVILACYLERNGSN